MNISGLDTKGSHAEILTGARAILDRLPALRPLAERWGQAAELAELPYLLSVPISPRREPLLVLLKATVKVGSAMSGEPLGAVLLFAYSAGFFGHRLLSHPDRTGRRCVFGAPSERTQVAVRAARALLQQRATLVLIPYRIADAEAGFEQGQDAAANVSRQQALCALGMMGVDPAAQWTLHGVIRPLELPLESSFDGTLTRIGKRTRRNLRAAMRVCEREQGCRLEWDPAVSEEEMLRFNELSTYRVRPGVVSWRYAVWKDDPQSFLAGIRNAGGEWLALAGGRRTADGVTLDWQMNRKFSRFSVSLVMRGLLMARFGAEGISRMRFEGGTTHALVRGFHRGTVYTLRIRRKAVWLGFLEGMLIRFFPSRAITHDLFGSQLQASTTSGPVETRAHSESNPL